MMSAVATVTASCHLDRLKIQALVPFSPEWLLVDRVVECTPPAYIKTEKQIAELDPIVVGHFKDGPAIFPGVLLVEYVSQSAYLLGRLSDSTLTSVASPQLLARCSASFLSPARANDLLTAEVRLADSCGKVVVYEGVVSCGKRLICRASVFASPLSMPAEKQHATIPSTGTSSGEK
jgi:3-hydroxymyristoyl/3-hydroxydecanoyl-(acyl carrier protein) dehydratase